MFNIKKKDKFIGSMLDSEGVARQHPLLRTNIIGSLRDQSTERSPNTPHKVGLIRCEITTRPNPAKQRASTHIAHMGFVLFITGIILSNRQKTQSTQLMRSGSQIRFGDRICCLRSIDQSIGPTYRSICGNIAFYDKIDRFVMFPEKRFYFTVNQEITNTKVAINTNLFSDLYMLIGTGSNESGWFVTVMELPSIFLIWVGFILGAYAGLTSFYNQLRLHRLKWY